MDGTRGDGVMATTIPVRAPGKPRLNSWLHAAQGVGYYNLVDVKIGKDIIGEQVMVGDVVLTVIDDKLCLVEITGIQEWKGILRPQIVHKYSCKRYRTTLKEVRLYRHSDEIFKVKPEQVAKALLTGGIGNV